ncbi:response regulator transcription factor [Eggerthella sinensis]|uniref:response regulator transcription factor n=1 Tax=Eggerthella sinensis TaxID=242230 RepID=UPI001D082BAB|nr:helix-turn-helix transcriptional regulator [Eggerthella sinensis]MCB7036142.1 helix-turn-helix transcriptional regulator [Eggerthella sinensis]
MGDGRRAEYEEQASPLAEQWPYLRFLGLGAWWAWIWLCYNSTEIMRMFPAESQTSYVYQMYLFSTLGIAASMFAAAFAWKRVTQLVDKRVVVVGFGALATLSTILLGFSVIMGAGAFFVIAALLTGVGTSFLCLKVGRIYGSVSLGDSLTAGAIALLFASLLYFVGVGVPAEWRLFYIAALPLMSSLLLVMGSVDPFSSTVSGVGERRDRRSPERRIYRKLVVASALVAVTAGVGKGVTSSLAGTELFAREGTVIVFCIGVIAVLIAVLVNRGDAVRGARQVYSALMVLGMAMMLATCFGFDIAFLSIGKEALWLVFSCFMAYLAFRFDLSPVRVFGVGQGVYFLASTGGWAVGSLIAPYYGEAVVRMGVGVGLAFLVVVVLVYVFPETDLKRVMAWSVDGTGPNERIARVPGAACEPESTVEEEPVAPAGIARATDPRYGLSQRELEILDLFAQGRSANWIADNFTISKNTVRSHLRAIYTKLDVHTRQELLDFLEG